jgi:hypothetical protein
MQRKARGKRTGFRAVKTMAVRDAIEIGRRFQEAQRGYLGKPAPLWIVEDVFRTPVDALGYARLTCVADPTQRKTLSVAVLSDRRRFLPIDPAP